MHYVNLDTANLASWFKHNTAPFNVAASTGNLSKIDGTGFSVYFSDRRNNRNAAGQETGEYGCEDFVNPAAANGVPNERSGQWRGRQREQRLELYTVARPTTGGPGWRRRSTRHLRASFHRHARPHILAVTGAMR